MLKFQIDASEAESLDPAIAAMYEADGDKMVLKVDGLPPQPDVTGLKKKVDELLGEKKAVQQRAAEALEAARIEEEERLKKAKNYEQLYTSSEAEREKAATQLAELQAQIQSQSVNATAQELASALTKDTARAKLLAAQINARLSLVDGEIRVLDANGNLTVSSTEELTTSIKTEYPFLVDGSQAAGGGATGSSGGAGDSKTVSRADFDAMSDDKRMAFVKSKGTVELN